MESLSVRATPKVDLFSSSSCDGTGPRGSLPEIDGTGIRQACRVTNPTGSFRVYASSAMFSFYFSLRAPPPLVGSLLVSIFLLVGLADTSSTRVTWMTHTPGKIVRIPQNWGAAASSGYLISPGCK